MSTVIFSPEASENNPPPNGHIKWDADQWRAATEFATTINWSEELAAYMRERVLHRDYSLSFGEFVETRYIEAVNGDGKWALREIIKQRVLSDFRAAAFKDEKPAWWRNDRDTPPEYYKPGNDSNNDVAPPEDEPDRDSAIASSRYRTRQEDKHAPPPKWLITDLIETDSDCAIYAPKSFLKSFAVIDLAYAIASGTMAFGTLAVTDPGPVVYYCGEGHNDVVSRRASAWEIAHNHEPFSIDDIVFINGAPYINKPQTIEDDITWCRDWLSGRRCKLIVIDTLNRALNGEDEDRAHTASKYLNAIKGIRQKLGGTTLTVAHMGKDTTRGGRGTSAFEMGFDTVLYVEKHFHDKDSDEHVICVVVKYQKSGPDGASYWLKTRPISTDAGASIVLEPCTEYDATALMKASSRPKLTPEVVAAAVRDLTRGGGNVSTGKLARELAERMDRNKDSVHRTLNRKRRTEFASFMCGDDGWASPCSDTTVEP